MRAIGLETLTLTGTGKRTTVIFVLPKAMPPAALR